jgi:hypothetical protein
LAFWHSHHGRQPVGSGKGFKLPLAVAGVNAAVGLSLPLWSDCQRLDYATIKATLSETIVSRPWRKCVL